MLCLELAAVHVLLDELGAKNKLRPCFVELPASEVCVEEAVNVRVHRLMKIDVSHFFTSQSVQLLRSGPTQLVKPPSRRPMAKVALRRS